jgi:hypothetical protein
MAEPPPIGQLLAAALTLRLGVIALADLLEVPGSHAAPTYTDVDYHVFTDAGALVLQGASPYARATFRYPPLLAWLGALNHVAHRTAAKVLFAAVDVAAGALMHSILLLLEEANPHTKSPLGRRRSGSTEPSRAAAAHGQTAARLAVGLGWLFNPVVVNVSTRGSADALPGALTVAAIFGALAAVRHLQQQHPLQQEKAGQGSRSRDLQGGARPWLDPGWRWGCGWPLLLGGAAHGTAAHLKLYPVVHLPGLLYFLGPCLATARVARPPLPRFLPAALTTEVQSYAFQTAPSPQHRRTFPFGDF